MDSRDPFFPWSGFTPGTHSVYSSAPRFPYNVTGSRALQGYVPGGLVHGASPFLGHAGLPASSYYGRGGVDYYAGERRPTAVSPTPRPRLRRLDDEEDAADPVVFNAGVTFRLGGETHVHRHVEVQPAHATPEAPSAALTRQIDRFLRRSDHALDRYKGVMESRSSSMLAGHRGRSVTPVGGLGLDSPDGGLSLRAQRSASAASIAVKAEKHLESMGPVGRRSTAPIAEREEDDFDTSSDSFTDLSEDTSADLSKVAGRDEGPPKDHRSSSRRTPAHHFSKSSLDDLSSDSDDEYFDVVALPGLRPPPPPPALTGVPPRPSPHQEQFSLPHNPPTHSRSLPAVNKEPAKRVMGNSPVPASPPTPRGTDKTSSALTHGRDKTSVLPTVDRNKTTAAPQQAPAHLTHKAAAPPPPPPLVAAVPSTTTSGTPDRPSSQASGRGGVLAGKGDTLRKYPAPQPPKDPKDTKDSRDLIDAKNLKDSKDYKDIKDLNDSKEHRDSQVTGSKQTGKVGVPDDSHNKQEGEEVKQEHKQNKPDRHGAKKDPQQQFDTLEKSQQNKTYPTEAPPRGETAASHVSSGDVEKPIGATQKPRRAPSFKKYPAPQPPAPSVRPKSDGMNLDAVRGDITAASSGSVPALIQSTVKGLHGASGTLRGGKAADTQSNHSGGKAEEKTVGSKQPPQSPTGDSPVVASSSRKVRAGSPVPEKVVGVGNRAPAAPVVTGKLEIATGNVAATVKQDSAAGDKVSLNIKVVAKEEDNKTGGGNAVQGSRETKKESKGEFKEEGKGGETKGENKEEKATPVDDKKIPNGVLPLSPCPEKTPSKTTQEATLGKLTKPTYVAIADSHLQDEQSRIAKTDNKTSDEVMENHLSNGTHEAREEKSPADDNSKYKKMNGIHNEDDLSGTHRYARSRSSSVVSDVVSPDVSQKSSGAKRSRGGKLAGIMNKFEMEDAAKGSEKAKPKTKVGKISCLASVFEAGKEAPLQISAVGSAKPPEKKAPETKPINIGGISTSKFGGVAKFKKPVDPKKDEAKPLSSEKKNKSNKESSTKRKDEVNGNNQEAMESTSSDKSEKNGEVSGICGTVEKYQEIKKPSDKGNKDGEETPIIKSDQVNGVDESIGSSAVVTEVSGVDKQDKSSKVALPKKNEYVNGVTESSVNDQEIKKRLGYKKAGKGNEAPLWKGKDCNSDGSACTEGDQELKKLAKSEKGEIKAKTKDTTETEIPVKMKGTTELDKTDSVVNEGPEALANGDLMSEESSLSSLYEIEKDVATAAPSAPDTPSAVGRGGMTQKATSEGPAKPAKLGDTESKITGGGSGSAKGTKDSGEKEAVSKGKVEGKADSPADSTVQGGEVLASNTEAAKSHVAKVDKSRSESTRVEATGQLVTPVEGVVCQLLSADVTKAEENRSASKDASVEAEAPKIEGTSPIYNDLQKDKVGATVDVAVTPPSLEASLESQRSAAIDVVRADMKLGDAKTTGAEATFAAALSEPLKEAPMEPLQNVTTLVAPLQQATTTTRTLEGDKMDTEVIIVTTDSAQPPAMNTDTAVAFSAGVTGRGVANSSSDPQLFTLGCASGFSWKTNSIRRKLNDAIENTTFLLPRMEAEVDALIREASDYLGPERRARRSWTPRVPGIVDSCPQLAASNNKSQGDDEDEVFEDAIDPSQLDTLMPLPDVQVERERRSRSHTPMEGPERSPSSNSLVAQAEALLSETDRLLKRSRSDKSLRRSYSRSLSSAALNKSAQEVVEAKCELLAREMLAEVTADLSEEHSTAHLAGERLEAEQAERMKLEKEVERLQNNMRMMTTANGKLEMEKQALQSEVLNGEAEHDEEEAADASLYRRKYEWCLREMELLKKQLKQQQEDDLDHLLLLKKQLEKKVGDAYEETEEQRQVVAQVKRKSQRLQAEMNDLKILLEEQTSRNNLLEKKQRKFDQDMMAAQEELRHERANKDKVLREKDQILAEKYSFEQEVATLKLELELKEEKLTALNRELEDLNFTGKAEEEVALLKKAKHDLELRVKDQEEELDDLAGQVQMLEGAKVRLEMSIEQMRKENRREVSQREEELEEVRVSAQKKVKALESQLENEHEERTLLVREKHELERRVSDLQDRTAAHVDEEYVHKLKKELKKTKALLRDTQTMLEKSQQEGGQKLLVRQLKTQLEDAEFAKTAAIKARQCAEADLSELTIQLEEAQRARKEAEDKCARVAKDRAEIQTQLEESEEEVAEVMKKYKSVVSQLSVDQITLSEQTQQIAELEHEKQVLHERLMELSSKVEVLEGETANIHTQRRLEMKIKEVESKLELEQTTRQRLESQIGRLKDQLERVSGDCDSARLKESQAMEQNKRVARQLREAKEDLAALQQRHTDVVNKKGEIEKQLELADSEVVTLKSDLKLAFKRIEDLQQAIQGDLNDSDSDLSDSDSDSDGSLSSYLTASLKQQMSSSNSTLRTPPSEVHQLDRMEQPTSPCSEVISEDLEESAAASRESFA